MYSRFLKSVFVPKTIEKKDADKNQNVFILTVSGTLLTVFARWYFNRGSRERQSIELRKVKTDMTLVSSRIDMTATQINASVHILIK